jgi:hypothetical protein
MSKNPPPPVIDSARVVSYAFVDDIPYQQHDRLFVGGKLLEAVPRLAIAFNLGKDIGPMLLHCDEEWKALGTSGAESVPAVKERAELNYPGVASRWVDVSISVEDALRFYDEQTGSLSCNFCGKRPFDLEGGWAEGRDAIICRTCVDAYHSALHEADSESSSDD